MTDERRYSQAELHAIFERAAERQEAARRAEAASAGDLTLAELQEVGAASGIDPAHIAAAAVELNAAPPKDVHTFLGAPTEVERVRVIPYRVSDEAWAQMVAEIRRAFDDDGSVGQIGKIREWTAVGRGMRRDVAMRLALEPIDGGNTRITLRQSVRETTKGSSIAVAIHAVMSLLFAVIALGEGEPDLLIAAVILGGMALAFAGGTWGWLRFWRPKQEQKFDGVLDRLELIARDTEPEAERTAEPMGENRIDLDALPDPADETVPATRRRTRS